MSSEQAALPFPSYRWAPCPDVKPVSDGLHHAWEPGTGSWETCGAFSFAICGKVKAHWSTRTIRRRGRSEAARECPACKRVLAKREAADHWRAIVAEGGRRASWARQKLDALEDGG